MHFAKTALPGVFVISPEPQTDSRGFFARIYCPREFSRAGITFTAKQVNLSRNMLRHTLRGLHWQDAPYAEAKLIRVTAGAIHEVIVDLRRDSPTFRQHVALQLDAAGAGAVFVPVGCAHGFLTLFNDTDIMYHIDRDHVPGHARGARFDDPALGIDWPAAPAVISDADLGWPRL